MASYKEKFENGISHKYDKKYQLAFNSFLLCYHENPQDQDVLFNLGEVLIKMKNFEDAKIYLTKAIALDPRDVEAINLLNKINRHFQSIRLEKEKIIDANKPVSIFDTNFLIYYEKNFGLDKLIHFLNISSKIDKLATSKRIYHEFLFRHQTNQDIKQANQIKKFVKIFEVKEDLDELEKNLEKSCQDLSDIKCRHEGRIKAWKNDLSIISLFSTIPEKKKYVVTNDNGIISIIKTITGEPKVYLRTYYDYITNINVMMKTGDRSIYEKDLFSRCH